MVKFLLSPLRIDTSKPDLMRAQLAAFSKQIPLLYFILTVNTANLAFTYYGHAPKSLSVYFPALLIAGFLGRFFIWLRTRDQVLSDDIAARRLQSVFIFGGIIGVLVLGWSLSLYRYGDAYTKSHITFFVAVTVIGIIFCLMHLRAAALLLTGITILPFTAFLLLTQGKTFVAIGINLFLVAGAMVYILVVASRDFERMVTSQLETRRLSDENSRLAALDSLTGLPNRRQFFSRLEERLVRAKHEKKALVVGLIDLDGFKPVNDLYGHAVGDRVLAAAGERLQDIANGATFLARLGGDEFAIILDEACETADVVAFGERVCAALQAPFSMPGTVINVSGSIGFAIFPEAGESAELLYERADYALYDAKQSRRGRPVIFSEAHETELRKSSVVEQTLRSADLDAEMSLHFQPLFDVALNKPIAFEALARWHSPELGHVPPNVFIAVAERSELINKLTQTLLRKALAAAETWPDDIHVSFNLSMRDLISPEAILQIITIVRKSGVAPGRIDFEITETALIGDFDQAQESIHALKALGARISLDDFGIGYSSLSYVHRLPLDGIKIDRSFVTNIEQQSTCRDIIKSVVGLCNNLNISCVVEGMETEGQADILRELGCNVMQGYLFSKPLPQDEVLPFLFDTEAEERNPKIVRVA